MATGPSAAAGTLGSRPLSHLLIYSLDNELNGSLELLGPDGSEAAVLVMARGCPVKIRTDGPGAYLGNVLCEMGYLAEANLGPTLSAIGQNMPHGQVLLENGLITQEQLVAALREQTLRKLTHLFSLDPETTFTFHDGMDLLADYGGGELVLTDPFPAVWWSIRDVPPEEHILALLARAAGAKFRLTAGERTDRFRFGPEETVLLNELRVRDLGIAELVALRLVPQHHVERLVYCLLVTKQVEVSSTQASASSAVPQPPPSARSVAPSSVRAPASPRISVPSPQIASSPPPARVSASPPAELTPREKAMVERARTIRTEDYFQRLSVARDASVERIDEAFAAVARLWDDSSVPLAVRDSGRIVHAGLVEAHETLRDPAKRDAYVKRLLLGVAHQVDPAEDLRESGADNELDGAKACLDKGDLERAERLARRAHKAKPDHGLSLALLAWIEAQRPGNLTTEATKARILKLDRAVRNDPDCEEALYYRAMLYMRIESYNGAIRDFTALLELNPDHREAARELRICEELAKDRPSKARGGGKGGPGGGFFGRLLK